MNLSYKERIVVVICISWLLNVYVANNSLRLVTILWYTVEPFVLVGVFPVWVAFGIMWIRRGKKDSDQDKDNTNPS